MNEQRIGAHEITVTDRARIVVSGVADVDCFNEEMIVLNTAAGALTIAGTLIIMLIRNWAIALVVVMITPLSLFVARFIAKRTYDMFRLQSETRGEMTAYIDEMIAGITGAMGVLKFEILAG